MKDVPDEAVNIMPRLTPDRHITNASEDAVTPVTKVPDYVPLAPLSTTSPIFWIWSQTFMHTRLWQIKIYPTVRIHTSCTSAATDIKHATTPPMAVESQLCLLCRHTHCRRNSATEWIARQSNIIAIDDGLMVTLYCHRYNVNFAASLVAYGTKSETTILYWKLFDNIKRCCFISS